jgi:hypothetical protein
VRSDLIFQRPTVQSAAITPAAIPTPLEHFPIRLNSRSL